MKKYSIFAILATAFLIQGCHLGKSKEENNQNQPHNKTTISIDGDKTSIDSGKGVVTFTPEDKASDAESNKSK